MLQDSIQVHLKASQGPITILTCELGPGRATETTACFLALEGSRIKTKTQLPGLELLLLFVHATSGDLMRNLNDISHNLSANVKWAGLIGFNTLKNVFFRFLEFCAGVVIIRPPGGAAHPLVPSRTSTSRFAGMDSWNT